MACLQRLLHIDKALIARATEEEIEALLGFDEGAIDQDFEVRQHGAHDGIGHDLLVEEAGVAPDGAMKLCVDAACQFGEGFGLIHRIATTERNIAFCLSQLRQNLIDRSALSCREAPRLRIVATRTGVTAAGAIDAATPTGSIDRRIDDDLHQLYFKFAHLSLVIVTQR